MPNSEIDRLEASLETPPTKDGDALAAALASRLLGLSAGAPSSERASAVRGLIAMNHHYYRVGDLARCRYARGSTCTFARPTPFCLNPAGSTRRKCT